MSAGYLKLFEEKKLKERVEEAFALLKSCRVCPRQCGGDRLKNEKTGSCRVGLLPQVSSYNPHFGEEPPISGTRGSGTIFFTSCNLHCCFCQNYPISQLRNGAEISFKGLAEMMMELQRRGCHNINLVSPSHFVPQILRALEIAVGQGLRIPLVYNCGGYESLEVLKILEKVVDIYMPDAKYSRDEPAEKYSEVTGYFTTNKIALKEMQRQVGDLVLDKEGIAQRGLLIRHLVLPQGLAGSKEILEFIAQEISPLTYLSVMAQYHPAYRSRHYPELHRRISAGEYDAVLKILEKFKLDRGWVQELE